ncbi:hypothetical protein EKO27_g2571 [Xylaria grammica]|uniref:Uncharacterized protein n=1 Tax=Xylaria grammica TaxID=363999 RepID=A0A439DDX8_9PEZI|nr:hypothetical protein EKO27_g2571 [Xylaria grammica]
MASFYFGPASNFYDRSTGSSGRQWHVKAPTAMEKPWNRVSDLSGIEAHHRSIMPSVGATSLVDLCLKVVVQNVGELNPPHLQHLPIQLLTITGQVHGGTHELLQLVQLKNLAVLEFIDLSQESRGDGECAIPQVSDSIVREWSQTPDPFPLLRVLRIWGNGHTTRRSLNYIHAFPCLVLYDIAGEKRDWTGLDEESLWISKKKTWNSSAAQTILRQLCLLDPGGTYGKEWLTQFLGLAGDEIDIPRIRLLLSRGYRSEQAVIELDFGPDGQEIDLATFCVRLNDYNSLMSRRKATAEFPDRGNFWGFLMYCFIGKLLSDRDLRAQGLEIGEGSRDPNAFDPPPRPMINVVLGERFAKFLQFDTWLPVDCFLPNSELKFETQLTFVRRDHREESQGASGSAIVESQTAKRPLDTSTATHMPLKKRQDVSSLLESFNQG